MSEATRTSIAQRMLTDPGLIALVDKDPNDKTSPAIMTAFKSEVAPALRCLTYRIAGDTPNPKFEPANATPEALAASKPVIEFVLEAEYWTLSSDTAPIEAVRDRLDALFRSKAWDVPSAQAGLDAGSEGRFHLTRRQIALTDLSDKATNFKYGLFRYILHFQTS